MVCATVHPYIAVAHEHSLFSLVRELALCGSMWLKLAIPHILWFVCWLYCLIFLCTFCSSCDNTGFSVRSAARKFKVFLPAGGAGRGGAGFFSAGGRGGGIFLACLAALCHPFHACPFYIFIFEFPLLLCWAFFYFMLHLGSLSACNIKFNAFTTIQREHCVRCFSITQKLEYDYY